MIETPHLTLIPASVALARAEIDDRVEFARLLGATVPASWPPETAADALPLFLSWIEAAPDQVGWFSWYALSRGEGNLGPVLVAGGGFLGPPEEGTAQIGYSVLPQFQGRGYATEMAKALVDWAMGQPGVVRIVAEMEWANPASVGVLRKVGFAPAGVAEAEGGARFTFPAEPPGAANMA